MLLLPGNPPGLWLMFLTVKVNRLFMNKIMKTHLLFLATLILGAIIASCSNEETHVATSQHTQPTTRSIGTKTPKLTVYIETNDVNPLNAKEYHFLNTEEEVIDHVILFASNIRGNAKKAWLYHNPNQTYILNNIDSLVRPLQQKGIKVLLGLIGDHTGVSFANLTPPMIHNFAKEVADCVTSYGLDGVDIGSEYGQYGRISGLPNASATILGNFIAQLRQLLPDKMVTAFRYGYLVNLSFTAMNNFDYMWPNFGCTITPPTEFPKNKWASLTIHITNEGYTTPSSTGIQSCANRYSGYGAIMMFNMREWDTSYIMNDFAPRIWGEGATVCWTGISHAKAY